MSVPVVVIGGGVVGCAVAHELARHGVATTLLEARAELAQGASGTNSGILHTGFDSTPGALETELILRSGELREQAFASLGVPRVRCGARMHPRDDAQRAATLRLYENARSLGVKCALEDDGSLHVPGESVTDPVAYTRALAGAAQAGGAELRLGTPVVGLEEDGEQVLVALGRDGDGDGAVERLRASAVVNCAGLYADAVAEMAGERPFSIHPRKGEFLVYEQPPGEPLGEILLPIPSALGKGVLVFPTIDGRHLIAGPTARERTDKADWSVEEDARELIASRAQAMFARLASATEVGAYAGLRTAGVGGANYAIEHSSTIAALVHVGAIRSTGLSASLGIAEHVLSMLRDRDLVTPRGGRWLEPTAVPGGSESWWQRAARRGGR
jgi:glycerol-3-phosphate dehydrogenase